MFALFSPRIDSHLLSFQWDRIVTRNTSQVGLLEDGLSLNNGTRLIIIRGTQRQFSEKYQFGGRFEI